MAAETLTAFKTRVNNLHRIPTGAGEVLTDAQVTQAIENALEEFSLDRPQWLTATVTPTADTWEYACTGIDANWADGYYVESVYYPGGKQYDTDLDPHHWEVYKKSDGLFYLRFFFITPDPSESIWVKYRAPHSITEGATTVPALDNGALAHLAAAHCCEMAASEAADEKDSTILADVVDYQQIAEKWERRASKLRKYYDAHIAARPATSGVFGEWDLSPPGPYRRPFWHGTSRF